MKKIAICGGAGFIGGHLADRLARDGNYVVVFDRKLPEFWEGKNPAHEYHVFDLRNSVDYFAGYRWDQFDEVYQLAAEMGGADFVFSGKHDGAIMHDSALINLNVLEACRLYGVPKVFFSSSACVYPTLPEGRLGGACVEADAGNPDSPYGMEKLFAESLYKAYSTQYGTDVRIGRFHNIFGSRGTWYGGREKAPAALCRKIAQAKPGDAIECYGDGTQVRSFLHVSECVEAVVRLMASGYSSPVNIGSEESITINGLIACIATIAGKKISIRHRPGPVGVHARNSDNELIQAVLDWKPKQPLVDGLRETYGWIAKQVSLTGAA